jgi:PAS domain-containing protein
VAFVLSNALVALALYAIAAGLIAFARRRQDLAFRWIFVLVGGFVLACGTAQIMDIMILWYPVYWSLWYQLILVAVVVVTAVLAAATSIALWRVMPTILRLPAPHELCALNAKLAEQVRLRERAEQDLRTVNAHLAEQASQLEAIFEAQTDSVAVYDLEGRFVRANTALQRLFGLGTDAEYTARPLAERAERLQHFDEQGQPASCRETCGEAARASLMASAALECRLHLRTTPNSTACLPRMPTPLQAPAWRVRGCR